MSNYEDIANRIANEAATELMTSGNPDKCPKRADRLALMRKGADLGGWNYTAIFTRIKKAIMDAFDESK